MAWAFNAVLPFFVLVSGSTIAVIHPLYHSRKVNRDTPDFPADEWEKEVKGIIIEAMWAALPEDVRNDTSSSKDKKKKRKSNKGIMAAQNDKCIIDGCDKGVKPANKVCRVCHKMVCSPHGNADEWEGNKVVQMVLDVCDDNHWLMRAKFICVKCILPKFIQKLSSNQGKNAADHRCPMAKDMKDLIAEYAPQYADNNNGGDPMNIK
ncbi:unnamed protein product [Vitrella brassicaformis CCMP3155]|uniref:Uncharacterized protein n=1 Tax=Vitrella brassicaformis (strain CCMP3155) TaxID=1169540 RepID=A0A0G4H5E3_VITBC|nr:unnamed protein product [Vitrella brassicaformis CCMP3155]|mmetsp:Transcript_3883/g.9787  ORF Transcript_3883/g.9787 Transcript_3883/m.9787 type:complete len:207 (+) Transcript_3883:140-760(+)|eukprot:CEM38932.1 unnamed protein product [Vitrella brassicaformis CCMP3155]